jgi:hypothetical protein
MLERKEYPRIKLTPRWMRMAVVMFFLCIIVPVALLHGTIDLMLAIGWTVKNIVVRNWKNETTDR